jgi:hypothetical protein
MTAHLKQSRIAKALTDRVNGADSFESAEASISGVRVAVVLMPDQVASAAGQAAALTATNTAFKCFGNVTLVGNSNVSLVSALPIGETVSSAAKTLGADIAVSVPADTTHVIVIGGHAHSSKRVFVRCWWNGWLAGIVPGWDDRDLGTSGNPLAGIFAGALAVREVFATVLGYPRCGSRVSVASLWEPGTVPDAASPGPATVYASPRLWFVGLGHVGQGLLWSLGFLPVRNIEITLQDDQNAETENEATGLLTRSHSIGRRKARIAAAWCDRPGWSTTLIERRHFGDIPLLDGDPSIVITSLDAPDARVLIAKTGFEYMIDAGIGHGPVDFEALQIRILKRGIDPSAFWSSPGPQKALELVMAQKAYRAEAAASDHCGAITLANASVSVPFVGAAVGALTISQAIRLASMQTTVQMMQMELGTPSMALVGATNSVPLESAGSLELSFA